MSDLIQNILCMKFCPYGRALCSDVLRNKDKTNLNELKREKMITMLQYGGHWSVVSIDSSVRFKKLNSITNDSYDS